MFSVMYVICDFCGSETHEGLWDGSWNPVTDMAKCSQCEFDGVVD